MKLLLGLISKENPESLIIFCNTKRTSEVVSKRLNRNGIESEYIIGDLPQKQRQKIMDSFKEGKVKCLVATDVAARGIDVNDLAMVINYDLPNEAENYVHRIGRTARAGKSGKAYTFCSEQDVYSLPPIERYIEKQIPSQVADESLFAEDKSAGVYIRTESYHEDYRDKSEYGRKKQREYEARESRRGGRNGGGKKSSRGKGRYSSRNEAASKEYKRDRRVFNAEEEAMLATMSTDERMKLYKERYGASSYSAKGENDSVKKSGNQSGSSKKHGSKKNQQTGKSRQGAKSSAKNTSPAKSAQKGKTAKRNDAGRQIQKTPAKKGFLSALKSLFSKKR
jgi:ATP-dependent RNA helicase RhlB